LGLSRVAHAFGGYLAQIGAGDIACGICVGPGGLCRCAIGPTATIEHGANTPLCFRCLTHFSCPFLRGTLDDTRSGGYNTPGSCCCLGRNMRVNVSC